MPAFATLYPIYSHERAVAVEGEAQAEGLDLFPDLAADVGDVRIVGGRDDAVDEFGNLLAFGDLHASRGHGRGADADAAGHER